MPEYFSFEKKFKNLENFCFRVSRIVSVAWKIIHNKVLPDSEQYVIPVNFDYLIVFTLAQSNSIQFTSIQFILYLISHPSLCMTMFVSFSTDCFCLIEINLVLFVYACVIFGYIYPLLYPYLRKWNEWSKK